MHHSDPLPSLKHHAFSELALGKCVCLPLATMSKQKGIVKDSKFFVETRTCHSCVEAHLQQLH